MTDLDGKASQVMGLSGTLIAIVLAALSIVADQAPAGFFAGLSWIPWTGILVLSLGVLLLLLAIVWSVKAYTRAEIPVGIAADDLQRVLDKGMDEENYLEAAVAAHVEGIRALREENDETVGQLRTTIRFFFIGLAGVTVGGGILIGRVLAI